MDWSSPWREWLHENPYGIEWDKTQNGPQSFKNTLKSASQLIDEAYKRGKGLPGVDTGFSGLNRFLGGLNKSDLIVLAGRPSMGKTALATNIAYFAAKKIKESQEKSSVAFFSLDKYAKAFMDWRSCIDA